MLFTQHSAHKRCSNESQVLGRKYAEKLRFFRHFQERLIGNGTCSVCRMQITWNILRCSGTSMFAACVSPGSRQSEASVTSITIHVALPFDKVATMEVFSYCIWIILAEHEALDVLRFWLEGKRVELKVSTTLYLHVESLDRTASACQPLPFYICIIFLVYFLFLKYEICFIHCLALSFILH